MSHTTSKDRDAYVKYVSEPNPKSAAQADKPRTETYRPAILDRLRPNSQEKR